MIGISIANSLGLSAAAAGPDPSASAYFAATGITGITEQQAIDNLVKGLKADGLWSKMKAVYPFVTDNRNLLGYTEDFVSTGWTRFNSTITSNTSNAPNGTLTADSFNDGTVNGQHQLYGQINSLPIGTYTWSIYLKSNTSTKNILLFPFGTSGTGGTGTGGVILTQNGTFVANLNGGVVSYGSQDVGNGWRRFYVVGTSTTISNIYPAIAYADGTNISYTGTNTDAFIWGAQLELGSTATTYQPIATTQQAFISSQFKYNLVNPVDSDAAFRLVFNGGWTHSANGALANGTNGYADTKLNAATVLSNASYNYSVYSRNQNFQFARSFLGATYFLQPEDQPEEYYGNIFMLNWFSNTMNINYTQYGDGYKIYNSSDTTGMFNVNNDTGTISLFKNGNNQTLGDSSPGPVYLPNGNIYIAACNFIGQESVNNFSNIQYAFSTIGDKLTPTQSANLYTRVQAFQTSLSRNI